MVKDITKTRPNLIGSPYPRAKARGFTGSHKWGRVFGIENLARALKCGVHSNALAFGVPKIFDFCAFDPKKISNARFSIIITISGRPGSGKSVVAKALAKKLKLKHYSTGELMRKMAKQRGVSLMALTQKARRDGGKIDRTLDVYQVRLGKTKKNFVIDGRLGFHFIPHSIKIFLEVSPLVAARRVTEQQRGGVEKLRTLAEAQRELKKRTDAERERYKKYYGIDYMQKKNYDLVIDTTRQSVDGVVKRILGFLKKKHHI